MDLDGFKDVNDSLGHEAGDKLLVSVAARLQGCLRTEDIIARLGGDEFTVLLEDIADARQAIRVAERITDEMQNPFDIGGHKVSVSTSIGICMSTPGCSPGKFCATRMRRCIGPSKRARRVMRSSTRP